MPNSCHFSATFLIFWGLDFTFDLEKVKKYITSLRARPHYSKSQIFVQKFNFDNTPTCSRVFHQKFFWQFFSWNQSCQQLKSPKPQHFHEFFIQKNRQFSREIKVEFLDKNEDFVKWAFFFQNLAKIQAKPMRQFHSTVTVVVIWWWIFNVTQWHELLKSRRAQKKSTFVLLSSKFYPLRFPPTIYRLKIVTK